MSEPGRRLRVVPLVVDDGLYTHRWLLPLFDDPRLEVVGVGCLSPTTARAFNPGGACGLLAVARARAAYYGPLAAVRFAALAAFARAVGLARHRPATVAAAARARGLPLLVPPDGDVHQSALLARLRSLEPDLLLCAFSQRARAALLRLPARGCLNVHFSLLPQHRGREPLFHALLAGGGAGVSVHWMTEFVDGGAVVAQQAIDVAGVVTLHRLILAACVVAARLVPEAVALAGRGPGPRDAGAAAGPLAGWPDRDAVRRFRARGLRFI